MATTAEYLNKLVDQKNTLADNLVTKGVDATHDETLDTLVPKVLEISSGGGGGNGIYPIGKDGRPEGDVIVPDGVVTLSKIPFNANANITSVSLPTSLTSISDNCFEDCTSLQSVNIPSSVTAIPSHCFSNCKKLTTVPLDNINEYGSYAFYKCSLPTINISSNCTNIGEYAFAYCKKLKNITIDVNSKYDLGQYCFASCTSLTNKDVESLVQKAFTLSGYIFQGCTGITDIEVKRVWHNMFERCTNLVHAIITGTGSSGNTGDEVFKGCTKLQEVYLAPNTKKISEQIFYNCTALKTVSLPSTITEDTNSCLTSTSSSNYAFYSCTALEDVQLGQDWNMSLRLNVSNNLTVDSMVAMFSSLKDLTGDTAKTLTLGSTNLAKLTDEQKAIATNKNWTLA